jgi:hypothetical protein
MKLPQISTVGREEIAVQFLRNFVLRGCLAFEFSRGQVEEYSLSSLTEVFVVSKACVSKDKELESLLIKLDKLYSSGGVF